MTDAREIVTETIRRHQASPAAAISNWVFHELTAAGHRILGPDEVDPVTVEKAAEVVECATLPMGRSGIRRVLAAAIRAIASGGKQ